MQANVPSNTASALFFFSSLLKQQAYHCRLGHQSYSPLVSIHHGHCALSIRTYVSHPPRPSTETCNPEFPVAVRSTVFFHPKRQSHQAFGRPCQFCEALPTPFCCNRREYDEESSRLRCTKNKKTKNQDLKATSAFFSHCSLFGDCRRKRRKYRQWQPPPPGGPTGPVHPPVRILAGSLTL